MDWICLKLEIGNGKTKKMIKQQLTNTIEHLLADDKGLLAMDESNDTYNKRFATLGIPQTVEARRNFREWIVTTPGLKESIIFKNSLWISDLKWYKVLEVILIGGTGATIAEIWHLSLGNWSYADTMPIIPVALVGLSPVLQFMTLSLLVYHLSFYHFKKIQ